MATIIDYINPLLAGEDLGFEKANALLDLVFAGDIPEPQIAAFLMPCASRGLRLQRWRAWPSRYAAMQ